MLLLLHVNPDFKISEIVHETKYPPSAYLWMAGGFQYPALWAGQVVVLEGAGWVEGHNSGSQMISVMLPALVRAPRSA